MKAVSSKWKNEKMIVFRAWANKTQMPFRHGKQFKNGPFCSDFPAVGPWSHFCARTVGDDISYKVKTYKNDFCDGLTCYGMIPNVCIYVWPYVGTQVLLIKILVAFKTPSEASPTLVYS